MEKPELRLASHPAQSPLQEKGAGNSTCREGMRCEGASLSQHEPSHVSSPCDVSLKSAILRDRNERPAHREDQLGRPTNLGISISNHCG